MNFGQALEALKAGKRVAREGWNGKGMWLVLVHPHCAAGAALASSLVRLPLGRFPGLQEEVHLFDWLGRAAYGNGPKLLPWIGMKTADDGFVPWLASQTDLLAEDWVEAV